MPADDFSAGNEIERDREREREIVATVVERF